MAQDYEVFVADMGELDSNSDVVLVLRDLRSGRLKYLAQNVLARVAHGPKSPDGYVSLRVRSSVGNELPGPWWLKVLYVLPARTAGPPYSNVKSALQAQAMDVVSASDLQADGPSL